MAIDFGDIIREWWDSYQADPRASYDNIVSGLRKPQTTTKGEVTYEGGIKQSISKSQLQTGACQYWICGLPSICSNWDFAALKCKVNIEEAGAPTGYGVGKCDALGRRDWCSMYIPIKEIDLKEYVCVAPCPEKSGIGRQVKSNKNTVELRPVTPTEVTGYNQDEYGAGKCDGWGLGRGNQKKEYDSLEDLYSHGCICKYYRPQQMGFGAIQAHPYHGSDVAGKPFNYKKNFLPENDKQLYDDSNANPLKVLDKRVPFVFQIYNARAMYQKCVHWDNSKPSFFDMSSESDVSLQSIFMNDAVYCTCNDSACDPYKTLKSYWPTGIPWIIADVIAEYGGVICNGAKPECPCYTGKWIYCTDNNMRDGMRITADQVLELRFWTSNWASQEEYDSYYLQKPGRTEHGNADESTSSIYTFTKWEKLVANEPNESIMLGYKHSMCMPAPPHMREFDPSIYISKTPIRYPKVGSNTGTNAKGTVSFPTLIRELENIDLYTPDIDIIYPYFTTNPWEIKACDSSEIPSFCVHDTNLMRNPSITFVGQSTPNSTIYVINTAFIKDSVETKKALAYINKYKRANQITDMNMRFDYNYVMDLFLKYCRKSHSGYNEGVTNENGLFILNSVELKVNSYNKMIVVCQYDNYPLPEFSFRKINVLSNYWMATITQNSMTHTHFSGTAMNGFPKQFEPGATINGMVNQNRGYVDDVLPLYKYTGVALFGSKTFIGYCLNEYEEEVKEVEHWTRVGSTGYIWAEIDDINLSYLWEFEVKEAKLILKKEEGDKPKKINLCGNSANNDGTTEITLSVVPTVRKNIPPNAVLLKADKPIGMFNTDWSLSIKYKYQLLETFKKNPVWPEGLDRERGGLYFRSSAFNVTHNKGANAFLIENAGNSTSKATFSVMAIIADEGGRAQTAAATKMLVQGYYQGNRNIEIEYIYSAPGTAYKLMPEAGFATWRGEPQVIPGKNAYHSMRAYCGDHNCPTENCIGPMWYPFDNCTKFAFYDFYTPAAQCYNYINEGESEVKKMGLPAWRYGVAPEYTCWVSEAGNWAATCGAQWRYYYSRADMSGMQFTGTAKAISTYGYDKSSEIMQWTPPPFGENSRAYIERYVSSDFIGFLNCSKPMPYSDSDYMPMVFGVDDMVYNPDCFYGTTFNGSIKFFPMMSNYVAAFAQESVSSSRYRFEDIITPILHRECSYPAHMVEMSASFYAVRYGFKSNNCVWAWPEYWRPIERNIDNKDMKFDFLRLYYPEYHIDHAKMEHRLVIEEGNHVVTFFPPEGGEEGGMQVYPSISIDGGERRFFEIEYSDYNSSGVVLWRDESSIGEVGSSDGSNIYELTNNNTANPIAGVEWYHNRDTIFDREASKDPDEDRMLFVCVDEVGEKKFGYYNRGLISRISINKLVYLPINAFEPGQPSGRSEEDSELIYFWDLENVFGVAPVEILIKGTYGVAKDAYGKEIVYDRPEISVAESEDSPVFDTPQKPNWQDDAESVGYINYIDGRYLSTTKDYELKLELDRSPKRFIRNLSYFIIRLKVSPGAKFDIRQLSVKVGKYIKSEEIIKTWERRFRAGIAQLPGVNADGPNTSALRSAHHDKRNSGQYFPMDGLTTQGLPVKGYTNNGNPVGGFGDIVLEELDYSAINTFIRGENSVVSKVCAISFTELTNEDEIYEVNMGNLRDIERDAQKEEFEKATNLEDHDRLDFSPVRHPAIAGWLSEINTSVGMHEQMHLQYDKVIWDRSKYPKWLNQDGDFWQPGGHYFAWSDKVTKTKCYLMGPVETLYDVEFVHHKHGGKDSIMDAGHSYAGYGRVEYQQSKYWVSEALGLDQGSASADLLTMARNGIMGGNG